jgi:geranylgeranylglycerol-phosphate geranylgeranyltransferase
VNLLLGFMTSFTLTGASMAINDYYDQDIDAINEPSRPIPSGLISPREALYFAFGLSILGLSAALLTNLPCLFIAIIAWIVSIAYTTRGKHTGFLGNLLVGTCGVVPFIYGGFAVNVGLAPTTLLFVAMAFLTLTGREVTKGIVDAPGDSSQNVRTLAVRYGEQTAAIISSVFFLVAVALSPVPWLLDIVSPWFLPLAALTDFGLVLSSVLLLQDYSRENARRIKNSNLIWFLTGLAAFIAGSFG